MATAIVATPDLLKITLIRRVFDYSTSHVNTRMWLLQTKFVGYLLCPCLFELLIHRMTVLTNNSTRVPWLDNLVKGQNLNIGYLGSKKHTGWLGHIGAYMGVSKNNRKNPKSSILIGFSIIFTPIFGNTHIDLILYPWLSRNGMELKIGDLPSSLHDWMRWI